LANAAGPNTPLAIETRAFFNGPTAVEMANRIADSRITCVWYEEPALPEFPDAIHDIRRQIRLPMCVGERIRADHGDDSEFLPPGVHGQ
jgi:galactonate dehydratase